MEAKSHGEQREGDYWVAGTRVSLDSLVYAFREGQTAESLAQSFPAWRSSSRSCTNGEPTINSYRTWLPTMTGGVPRQADHQV